MIGLKQSVLNTLGTYYYDSGAGVMRDASGAPRYLFATSTVVRGWSQEWALGSTGLACSLSTFNGLHGATAVTSPVWLAGCYVTVAGAVYQLTVSVGAALPDAPPPPPPP